MPRVGSRLLTIFEESFIIKSCKLWNVLPAHLTQIASLSSFKVQLQRFVCNIPDEPPVVGYPHRNNNSLTEQCLYWIYVSIFFFFIMMSYFFPSSYLKSCVSEIYAATPHLYMPTDLVTQCHIFTTLLPKLYVHNSAYSSHNQTYWFYTETVVAS